MGRALASRVTTTTIAQTVANNPTQGLHAALSAAGDLQILPTSPSAWSVTLRWSGWGRGQTAYPVTGTNGTIELEANRATVYRNDGSAEWYLNGPLGIEQGFVLVQPPATAATGALLLELEVAGELHPALAQDGASVSLQTVNGTTILRYSDLFARDADGRPLETWMEVHQGSIRLRIDDHDARYPLEIDPLVWTELKKIEGASPVAEDKFGSAVAIDFDTAIVGVPNRDYGGLNRGAAYVFYRNLGGFDQWQQQAMLVAQDSENDALFGITVALEGDNAIVGAHYKNDGGAQRGAAYVFSRHQGSTDGWGQVTKLTPGDAENEDEFGFSVGIDGELAVVGAHYEDHSGSSSANRGAAYVFDGNSAWAEVAKLTADDAADNDEFGASVGIYNGNVVVGAPNQDHGGPSDRNYGAAYVFQQDYPTPHAWGQRTKLTAADAAVGDHFGWAIDIDFDKVIVGAPDGDHAGYYTAGVAYIFERHFPGSENWGQRQKLLPTPTADGGQFGYSVAIWSDRAIVGAYYEHTVATNRSGVAYLFAQNHGGIDKWGRVGKFVAQDGEFSDYFGRSVAITKSLALVGAPLEDGAVPASSYGAAYVLGVDLWGEVYNLTATDAENGDQFGTAVALHANLAVVTALYEDGSSPNSDRGAGYVFYRNLSGSDSWDEKAKLTALDAQDDDRFGTDVAVANDTVVVGAPEEDGSGTNRGAAYVYQQDKNGADQWGQVTKIQPLDPQNDDEFGYAVAIWQDIIVVGAPFEDGAGSDRGAAYVFDRHLMGLDNWGQVTKITADVPENADQFGYSVSLSGDTLIVGANYDDEAGPEAGAAYIFERHVGGPNGWGTVRKLTADDASGADMFGSAVAVAGDFAIVGAPMWDGSLSNIGAAYVFERDKNGPGQWGQVKKLTAPDPTNFAKFGYDVDVHGETVVVGSPLLGCSAGTSCGQAYVFSRNQNGTDQWGQVRILKLVHPNSHDNLGASVAVDGDTALLGAPLRKWSLSWARPSCSGYAN